MTALYEELIVDIPDYPTEGVVFKDITPVIANPEAFSQVIDGIATHFADLGITKVIGAEAPYQLGAGFVPARKHGKLPRETFRADYELEYGHDALEIHQDALCAEDRVLIVDDLIATGGTVRALVKLVEDTGAELAGLGFFLELGFLSPRAKLAEVTNAEVFSLVNVEG